MKRCLSIACLLMLVASSVAGAATKASNELLFGFSGLNTLSLDTYQGGIAVRHYMSDNLAIRPGVSLGIGSTTVDGVPYWTDGKVTSSQFGLDVAVEQHMGTSKTVSPYVGADVGFAMDSNKEEFTHPLDMTGVARREFSTTVSNTGFMVAGLVGFQWFFTESVSLGGEYQFGLSSASRTIKEEWSATPAVPDAKGSGFGVGFYSTKLAISVAL